MQKVPQNIASEYNQMSLVYETTHCGLFQCDQSETFFLQFQESTYTFRVCELISFKRKIQNWDVLPMLSPNAPDVEILHLRHCDRMMVFTLHEILELKELFSGAFTMLELNSLIHKQLIRKPVFG